MSAINDSPSDRRELYKVIAAAFIGTVIEWYDFFLYGSFSALVFDKLFFSNFDPWTAKMLSFGTFAAGFFFRPLGGILFGYIGDRYGRKVALVWTLSLMGAATFLVGCLPTREAAGILAPILLVVLRCAQGVAVGGEWGGAVLMTVEHGHSGRRGFYGSWTQAGVPAGNLLAFGALSFARKLPEAEFLSWGWRIPFWFGIVITIIGFVIRRHIEESPLFARHTQDTVRTENPLLTVVRTKWRNVLLVVGARFAENASFYVLTIFILSYAEKRIDVNVVTQGVMLGSALEFIAIPLYGALSDRIGRRPVYLFGTIGLALFAYPFFLMFNTGDTALIWLALLIFLAIFHAAMYAPQAAFFAEMFGTNMRFSGASLGYQLSAPLAGGLAANIATVLIKWDNGKPWLVAAYLTGIGVLSTVSVILAAETHKSDITR